MAEDCSSRLLVSGYGSDNVHVFDECDGSFIRRLDTAGRIDGAQGLTTDDQGRLYVVSEENGRVLRYRSSDLAFIDVFVGPGGLAPLSVKRPTGIAISANGDVYVAGYDDNNVVRLDSDTGAQLDKYSLASAGVSGADSGLAFLPDGRLLVPGFDSNNIVVLDPVSGDADTFIPAGTSGLANPRVIQILEEPPRILVSSWGSHRLLSFDLGGTPIEEVLRMPAATGFLARPDGGWLAVNDSKPLVHLFDADGKHLGALIDGVSGGLSGATFLHRLNATIAESAEDSDPAR